MYVVKNRVGYLHVTNTDKAQWCKSIYNADKFTVRENAERNADRYSAVVIEISPFTF